jgi:hypothetical protein
MKWKKKLAFIGTVAGISIVTPYVFASVAKKFPSSPVATFNRDLHKAEQP